MRPYYSDSHVTIYHGDCRDVLPSLDPVETCITDPPYGLAFMGKAWDHAVPDETYWRLVRDAVLPGGMLLAFGGTRLWHWLAVGVENAGWEIRDTLVYMYGSGFPKSLDISKAIDKAAGAEREQTGRILSVTGNRKNGSNALVPSGLGAVNAGPQEHYETLPATDAAKTWDGWGSALKPAWEPIILAMNPLDGTFAENALEHGVAGLNIDGARIGTEDTRVHRGHVGAQMGANGVYGTSEGRSVTGSESGRWPANLALDEDAARLLDEMSGELHAPGNKGTDQTGRGGIWTGGGGGPAGYSGFTDSGGASRFFYTSKASRSDRGPNNDHPTVKPSDLMRWLCTLTATPTGGTVLDPFMGSGTTLYSAKEMGRKAIGIELEERNCEIAAERCSQGVLDLGGAA